MGANYEYPGQGTVEDPVWKKIVVFFSIGMPITL